MKISYLQYAIVIEDYGRLESQKPKDMNKEIALGIASHLGGTNRLVAMTGANNFVNHGNGLSFRVKSRIANYVKITLNGLDLYDVEIGKIHGNNYKVVKAVDNLYFDNLIPVVEDGIKMRLKLF